MVYRRFRQSATLEFCLTPVKCPRHRYSVLGFRNTLAPINELIKKCNENNLDFVTIV